MFNTEENEILIRLISNEQIDMITKDYTKYESNLYRKLEELKIKVKEM